MAKLTFLILGLSLLGWFLSGYLPGRRIDIEKGKYYAIGIAKNILFYIKGRNMPWFLSKLPLFWPLNRVFPELHWKVLVSGKKNKNETLDTGEEKYKTPEEFSELEDKFLGKREEKVPFLLELEPVAYKIPVIDIDGHEFIFIFTLILDLYDPDKTIGKPDFKMLGENELKEQIRAWAIKKTLEEIYATNTAALNDPECGIEFKDPSSGSTLDKNVDIETFLNKYIFEPLGVKIHQIQLAEVIPNSTTKEIFKLKQKHAQILQETVNAETTKKLKEVEMQIALAEAKNQSKIAKEGFKNYMEPVKEMISEIYKGQANVASQHPYLLAEVHGQSDQTGPAIVKEFFAEIKKSTAKNPGGNKSSEEGAANAA